MPENKKSHSVRIQKKMMKNKENTNANEQLEQPNSAKPLANLKKNAKNFSNIIEVTEQYETQRFNTESIEQVSELIKKNKTSFWQKSILCLKWIFPCFQKSTQFSIIVRQQQLIKTIQKLRTQKLKCQPVLPPLEGNKKTLVLDIDQTLVFSSQTQLDKYDFSFTMPYKKSQIKVYSKNRFGLESFLFEMSKIYEIIIYTTNIRQYAQTIIKYIDKKKRISHVLYKQKCVNLNKIHFLKTIKVLGRNPQNVVFIDHNVASGILQPKNFIQIKPYIGQRHDRQLVKLIPFLRQLASKDTVIPANKFYEQYCNRQIRLKFNSIDQCKPEAKQKYEVQDKQNEYQYVRKHHQSIMNGKKRKYGHKKNAHSQIESIVNKEETSSSEKNQESQSTQTQETQLSIRVKDVNISQAF